MSAEIDKEAQSSAMELEIGEGWDESKVERIDTTASYQSKKSVDPDHLDLQNKRAANPDDSDGKVEWNFKIVGAAIALTGLYIASQLPLDFCGGALSFIAADIGAENDSWYLTSNQLALCAFSPFAGYLTDLVGRRYITLAGGLVLTVGMILVATAHRPAQIITGMTLAGEGGAPSASSVPWLESLKSRRSDSVVSTSLWWLDSSSPLVHTSSIANYSAVMRLGDGVPGSLSSMVRSPWLALHFSIFLLRGTGLMG
jgi:MFS family permease